MNSNNLLIGILLILSITCAFVSTGLAKLMSIKNGKIIVKSITILLLTAMILFLAAVSVNL